MADQPPPPYSDVNTPSEEAESQPSPQVPYPPPRHPSQKSPGYSSQQMGHPPEQAGYPPQQPGYPPQQQGYPPQPAGAPPPGYQQQKGHPPVATGYPQQGQGYVLQPGGYTASNTTNTVIVTQQPQVTAIIPTYVNDYMGLSVFTCLCCCWCIGLFAIIKSTESRSFSRAGNYEQAVASAITARNLGYASLIFGLLIYVGFMTGALVSV